MRTSNVGTIIAPNAMGYGYPNSVGTNSVGDEVGFDGWLVGIGDGTAVGRDVGRLVGTLVGRLDDGEELGVVVSPGFVG